MATIDYWLQIENHPWDVMPHGLDRLSGVRLTRASDGLFKAMPSEALIIRRYSANWQSPDDRPVNPWDLNEHDPAKTQGTIPGAAIEARVGDELVVHFRNMDMRQGVSDAERTHSLHAHGLQRAALYDGTYPLSPPDPSQGGKQGDRVPPGESFDYHYTCYHAANAGTWLYHDHSMAHHQSMQLGAFGAIIIRPASEGKPDLPTTHVGHHGDDPMHFDDVPVPPNDGEHILVFHELVGVGECLNGRQQLGNTPTLLAGPDARLELRVINLTDRPQAFHLHGHRWLRGNTWLDSEVIASAATLTIEMLEGSAENGGGLGEWLLMSHAEPMAHMANGTDMMHHAHALTGSLLVTEGGTIHLPSGSHGQMPGMEHGGQQH